MDITKVLVADCEKVTHSGGLPRCPDGFHRSSDGDCERVSSVASDDDERSEGANDDSRIGQSEENNDIIEANIPPPTNGGFLSIGASGCKGSADCFRGTVTEIVDGDTLDVNNVRIRLSMVNTPEIGEAGYNGAIETTESICPLGSFAIVDEDDGQKEGSYDG
jgi:hypothetical protein